MPTRASNGNGARVVPILGALITIILTSLIGIVAYLNSRIVTMEGEIAYLQSSQAATVAMANARLDALNQKADHIEEQVEALADLVLSERKKP